MTCWTNTLQTTMSRTSPFPTHSKITTPMRSTGPLTKSLGPLMVKSSARRKRAIRGTRRQTAMTTLRHLLASSFHCGQQGSRRTLKGQLNGVADWWIGTAKTSKTMDITMQRSRRSPSSATILHRVQRLLGRPPTSIPAKLAPMTRCKSPTRLPS